MASCNDISAALARLEAKIDACAAKTIDEDRIVRKSVQATLVSGEFLAVSAAAASAKQGVAFATSQLSQLRARQIAVEVRSARAEAQANAAIADALRANKNAGDAMATAKSALGKAGDAFKRAWDAADKAVQANSRALDAISRVAGLVGAFAGIMALLGTVMVVIPQLAALQNRVTTLEIREVRTFQIAIAANQTALEARNLARTALLEAKNAVGYALQASARASIARNDAAIAMTNSNAALSMAGAAGSSAAAARGESRTANLNAKTAIEIANSIAGGFLGLKVLVQDAIGKATNAIAIASSASAKATAADNKATAADIKATKADTKAGDAQAAATSASAKATQADVKATKADTKAGDAQAAATSASAKATQADVKATKADTKATNADVKAADAQAKARNAEKIAWNTVSIANIADAKATNAQTVGASNSTRISNLESRTQQLESKTSVPDKTITKDIDTLKDKVSNLEKNGTDKVNESDIKRILDDKLKPDYWRDMITLGAIAATPILINATKQGLQQSIPTIEKAAQNGFCRTTAPGGCTTKALNNFGNGLTNDLVGKLGNAYNTAANTAQLAMLAPMKQTLDRVDKNVAKNGNLLSRIFNKTNEIREFAGDKFDKLYKALGLDRAVQLMTLAATLHNASMLSVSLKDTLLETTANVMAVVGIKDAEGSPLDLNQIFGKGLEDLIKSIVGEQTYTNTKTLWLKANRILSTGSQLLWSFQSMQHTLTSGVEVVGGWVAKIGNNMKDEGVFSDRAYGWMNENPNFKNPILTQMEKLENLDEAASQINQLASTVLEFKQTGDQIKQQKAELDKQITDFNATRAAIDAQKETQSTPKVITSTDLLKHEPS